MNGCKTKYERVKVEIRLLPTEDVLCTSDPFALLGDNDVDWNSDSELRVLTEGMEE